MTYEKNGRELNATKEIKDALKQEKTGKAEPYRTGGGGAAGGRRHGDTRDTGIRERGNGDR
jgi:hypothetical protein